MSNDDQSLIMQALADVAEHLEITDPQPNSIMITEGHVTMTLASIDDLLTWYSTIMETDASPTIVAERLWKQNDQQPSPTVLTLDYLWEEGLNSSLPCRYRLCASSPHTMKELADLDADARIEVTHSQVVDLMLADKTRDLSM